MAYRCGHDATARSSTVKSARLRPQVIIFGLVSLLNDAASEMIFPLLPVFLTSTLGTTAFVVGIIEGGADALASILKFYAGAWSDRMKSRKSFVTTGYGLAAASRGLIAVAYAWPVVLMARLIDRAGKGLRSAPRDAMITDVTGPDERGRAFGFQRALDHTGAIIGPLLAMLLISGFHLSLRTVFALAVIPGAVGVVLLMTKLREPPRVSDGGEAPRLSGQHLPAPFWRSITAIALFSLANSSDAFLILQAHAAGVTTAMLPLLWSAHHVIKSLFSTRAGALSDRMNRTTLLIAGWTIYAIIYFVFPFSRSTTFFFVLFIVYAIPFTLTEGAERAWIAERVPPELRGKGFGYYYLANGVCVLAGTALFGWLYDRVSHAAAFDTGAALALAAAAWVFLCRRS
jgi:MFS family permease